MDVDALLMYTEIDLLHPKAAETIRSGPLETGNGNAIKRTREPEDGAEPERARKRFVFDPARNHEVIDLT